MKEIRSNTIVWNNILYYTIMIWRNQIKYDCNKQYTILYNNNMKEIRSNTIVTINILYHTIILWNKYNQIRLYEIIYYTIQ